MLVSCLVLRVKLTHTVRNESKVFVSLFSLSGENVKKPHTALYFRSAQYISHGALSVLQIIFSFVVIIVSIFIFNFHYIVLKSHFGSNQLDLNQLSDVCSN